VRYLPKSDAERRQMLEALGLGGMEELFAHIPAAIRLSRPLNLPDGLSEMEVLRYFRERAEENAAGYVSFLGAGVYHHFRPVVIDSLISRGEFYTAYTPYQAEIAQGTLQSIFEFQSMICQLTGMEVANASVYDGSTALPEAVLMAARITGRRKVAMARSVHPEYRQVLDTYTRFQGIQVRELEYDREAGTLAPFTIEDGVAAIVLQSPNFFGIVEDIERAAEAAHASGALLIVVITEPVSLGLLKPPASADIVAMETQAFGMAPSYGGPYAGVIATREKYVRNMPGRLVGQTTDAQGRRGFCLTLATREQHIRREKATSNICTNQALCALMAAIFMTVYGKEGLRELARQNLAKAHYAAARLKLKFSGPFFNEFVVAGSKTTALLDKKILGGLNLRKFYPELGESLLVSVTEVHTRQQIDELAAGVKS
jgi:glycine dehydrogenase subunit 1